MKVNSEINIVMKPKTLFHNYKIIKVNTLIDSYEKFSFATINQGKRDSSMVDENKLEYENLGI